MSSRWANWVVGKVSLPKERQLQQELDLQRLYILTQLHKAAEQGKAMNMPQLMLKVSGAALVHTCTAVPQAGKGRAGGDRAPLFGCGTGTQATSLATPCWHLTPLVSDVQHLVSRRNTQLQQNL